MSTPEHSIIALCQRSRDISLEKGWLNEDGTDPRPFHTVTSLFHSELSEGFEDIRNNKEINELYYEVKFKEGDGTTSKEIVSSADIDAARKVEGKYGRGRDFLDAKPCGFPVELADYAIRIAQYYGSAGLGEILAEHMNTIATNNIVGGTPITDDPELFITQLHACTSLAWLATPDASAFGIQVPVPRPAINIIALAFINLFAFCRTKDIDLWAAIDEKEAYNRTRPIKHGGKKM